MVIEPPGNFRRAGIFEIDDGVLIAIKLRFIEQRARAMEEAGIDEVHVAAHAFAIKAAEERRRACPVKTLVVIKNPNSQMASSTRSSSGNRKTTRVAGLAIYVKMELK